VTAQPETGTDEDGREPGYCAYGCGFHLVRPLPGYSAGICRNCEAAGRMNLPPPQDSEYARTGRARTLRQQRKVQRTAEQFWEWGNETDHDPLGAWTRSRAPWRFLVRNVLGC